MVSPDSRKGQEPELQEERENCQNDGNRSEPTKRRRSPSDQPPLFGDEVCLLLDELGQLFDPEEIERRIRVYNRKRRLEFSLKFNGLVLLMGANLCLALGVVETTVPEVLLGYSRDVFSVYFYLVLAAVSTLGLLAIFYLRWSKNAARRRYFEGLGRAMSDLRRFARGGFPRNSSLVGVLNKLGGASRELFLHLQGSRRVWKSPPMVVDRAERLSSPLVDFAVLDDMNRLDGKSIARLELLLREFCLVVAVEREDLLPAVRERYTVFPRRHDDGNNCFERDMLYLNALRDRSKWDVAKDFWYPIAPWLSLVVAIAALVVSIT